MNVSHCCSCKAFFDAPPHRQETVKEMKAEVKQKEKTKALVRVPMCSVSSVSSGIIITAFAAKTIIFHKAEHRAELMVEYEIFNNKWNRMKALACTQ